MVGQNGEDEAPMPLAELSLQYNTVRLYISAIMRLYLEQKGMGINRAPEPKGLGTKILKSAVLKSSWAKKKRREYRDRGVGTIKDAYLPRQIADHTAACLDKETHKQMNGDLRTSLDFLLGNHMLLRGSNRRPVELPDLFCVVLPNEGLKTNHRDHEVKAFVMVMNEGKTNQHGRMEYGAALRHRDPLSCVVGSAALYFFFRWQVEKIEPFPDFSRSEKWYNTKVLRRTAKNVTGKC